MTHLSHGWFVFRIALRRSSSVSSISRSLPHAGSARLRPNPNRWDLNQTPLGSHMRRSRILSSIITEARLGSASVGIRTHRWIRTNAIQNVVGGIGPIRIALLRIPTCGSHEAGSHEAGSHKNGPHQPGSHCFGSHNIGSRWFGSRWSGSRWFGSHCFGSRWSGSHCFGSRCAHSR